MAGADYRCCDVCGGKSFYDASLNYDYGEKINGEWVYPRNAYKVVGEGGGQYDTALDYLGDWAVICVNCAKTYKTAILPKEVLP